MMGRLIAAFSGGKDSTAMVLRMWERGEKFELFFTPAGNEPPEVFEHIEMVRSITGMPLVVPPHLDLFDTIRKNRALPNHRQRFCTRQIKIEPCIKYLRGIKDPVLCVGLRADEEDRDGLYGPYAQYRYPLREDGYDVNKVWDYLNSRGIVIPQRTDCMLCYGQRLSEWWMLWKHRPDEFAKGVVLENRYRHTFRSPSRDTWPASLKDLAAEFASGRVPRGIDDDGEIMDKYRRCKVCSL